jgi:hypothetical protein
VLQSDRGEGCQSQENVSGQPQFYVYGVVRIFVTLPLLMPRQRDGLKGLASYCQSCYFRGAALLHWVGTRSQQCAGASV